MKTYNIASIEGDGIGKEVVPEAHKVLKKIQLSQEDCMKFQKVMKKNWMSMRIFQFYIRSIISFIMEKE